MQKKNMLIIDDESSICNVLRFAFENDYDVMSAVDLMEVKTALQKAVPDIVLLDLKFGIVSGIDVLRHIKYTLPDTEIIMMTAYGTIETSIEAIKLGAFNYIQKPLDLDCLKDMVKDASLHQDRRVKVKISQNTSNETIVGESTAIKKLFQNINRVKNLDVNILIEGESGTGKELVARSIHFNGKRHEFPFIVVNCSAIPKELIESELFGYEKGAFTGAYKDKKGAFELADKGSIFLDEIGEMELSCQAKVLRVIQNKEIFPIGAKSTRKVDVRIIAATNRKLRKECDYGKFRLDLYYRLNVFPITVPRLNDRLEDIPLLVQEFIKKANKMYGMELKGITKGALQKLMNRNYSGNVRELENIVYRAAILCDDGYIGENCIQKSDEEPNASVINDFVSVRLGSSLYDVEKQVLFSTLKYVNGNKAKAARLLGISERSIYYKIQSYEEEQKHEN